MSRKISGRLQSKSRVESRVRKGGKAGREFDAFDWPENWHRTTCRTGWFHWTGVASRARDWPEMPRHKFDTQLTEKIAPLWARLNFVLCFASLPNRRSLDRAQSVAIVETVIQPRLTCHISIMMNGSFWFMINVIKQPPLPFVPYCTLYIS